MKKLEGTKAVAAKAYLTLHGDEAEAVDEVATLLGISRHAAMTSMLREQLKELGYELAERAAYKKRAG